MSRRRAGFTLIEILVAMTIVAILAGIVVPKTGDFIKRAKATAIGGNIDVIHNALSSYYTDSLDYPPSAAMGQVPPGLQPYLPLNLPFVTPDYQLEYSRWKLTTAIGGYAAGETVVGITVSTSDARLGELLAAHLSLAPHFQVGNEYTFLIDAR